MEFYLMKVKVDVIDVIDVIDFFFFFLGVCTLVLLRKDDKNCLD